jgi:hypothetical protein
MEKTMFEETGFLLFCFKFLRINVHQFEIARENTADYATDDFFTAIFYQSWTCVPKELLKF